MKKRDVIAFFDRCAAGWDGNMVRKESVITTILDNAGVQSGARVLDVACGTGVLIPDYLNRGAVVTAVDISPEMVRIAQSKFPDVEIICADAEELDFDRLFDTVMIYNAFPHFPDPERIIAHLSEIVRPGGSMSVAHSMSREALLAHHRGSAASVSVELPEAEKLAEIFDKYLRVTKVISDDEMYQIVGIK